MTNKDKERLRIDDLLSVTDHKRIKEFMRTDKPSRRKLYIEIYEFKDKAAIDRLPVRRKVKEDAKADNGIKSAVVEFDIGSREIIQMKLSNLGHARMRLMRLVEYFKDINTPDKQNNCLRILGEITDVRCIPEKEGKVDFFNDPERYYLMVNNDTIIGFIGIAWKSVVSADNREVVRTGGDITSLGIRNGSQEQVVDVLENITNYAEFKDISIMRLSKHLIDKSFVNWRYLSSYSSWMPAKYCNQYNNTNLWAYYSEMPKATNIRDAQRYTIWRVNLRENFLFVWKRDHLVTDITTEQLPIFEADFAAYLALETEKENGKLMQRINDWIEDARKTLTTQLFDMSPAGVIKARQDRALRRDNDRDGRDGDDGDEENESPCDNCEESQEYCDSGECPHSGR